MDEPTVSEYFGETGRTLPSAPEFGGDGSWPPVRTPWLALRWQLFEAESNEASTTQALHLWRLDDQVGDFISTIYAARN